MLRIFFVLLFAILFGSCKTCDCPAYSQNNTHYRVLEAEKINVSLTDSLFATQNTRQNIGLTN